MTPQEMEEKKKSARDIAVPCFLFSLVLSFIFINMLTQNLLTSIIGATAVGGAIIAIAWTVRANSFVVRKDIAELRKELLEKKENPSG
ncbi:MAG: hypothetical protein G01um101419_327 [Parcubacteria group bacterium Gr01-1014_19]|nr:MAG: hypothetical protein G01um101419_327 [Parcubacteria group bacterium Gr01-1014_19]